VTFASPSIAITTSGKRRAGSPASACGRFAHSLSPPLWSPVAHGGPPVTIVLDGRRRATDRVIVRSTSAVRSRPARGCP
jgi:hypothetical protein